MYCPYPPNWWMATDLATETTFIAEPTRGNARLLRWSAMPARVRRTDVPVNRGSVPIHLRRAAAMNYGHNPRTS